MLGKDIKNLLITFFSELINSEKNVDINRQVLSESADFNANQIFNYLLSLNDSKKNITIKEIKNYLNTNNIEISDQEAKLIILFYDINSDGELSFDEFINLIRSENSSNNNKIFGINDVNISFSINYSLCKLFQKEISISKKIINSLRDLRNKRDFNLHDIFHT